MQTIVSTQWLNDHLDDPDLIILDATIPSVNANQDADFQDIQIPGARFFDLKGVFSDAESKLPNMLPSPAIFESGCQKLGINAESQIVIYDKLGIYSSPRARWMFKVMGHDEVAVLDGGFPAWIDGNYETEPTEVRLYASGDFEANYRPDLVRDSIAVAENISQSTAIVIDARSAGRFNGTAPEPRKELKVGHIPGSLNLPYGNVLRDGHFLPKPELASVINDLELGDAPLIFTCGSGITACIIMLACEMVNKNGKSVYDGSWSEWGRPEENFPIRP